MAIRNIVKIDEDKCNGCGKCIKACVEGAIQLVNGKAKLVSEIYCDGLGACIGSCPQDAITIEQRKAEEFDEVATKKHLAEQKEITEKMSFACPGMMAKQLEPAGPADDPDVKVPSQLGNWPVQLKLVPPNALYLQGCDLLLAADCVPFAMGDFHRLFMKGRVILIGCPKLDDKDFYIDKLASIIQINKLKSLTVVHMEVPCCLGLKQIAQKAVIQSGFQLAFDDVIISIKGEVLKTEKTVLDNIK
jgi:ferredoxin